MDATLGNLMVKTEEDAKGQAKGTDDEWFARGELEKLEELEYGRSTTLYFSQ